MQDDFDKYAPCNSQSIPAASNFTMILNEAIRDPRLSWRAKGILAGCLSHGATFKFNKAWILSHGTEGRDAVTKALSELRQLGYLENRVERCEETGRVKGEWLIFRDAPIQPETSNPRENPRLNPRETSDDRESGDRETRLLENRLTGKPDAGKPVLLRRTRNPEDQFQENQLESAEIAGAVAPSIPERNTEAPQARPGAPARAKGRPSAMERAIASLPPFMGAYEAQVAEWLQRRKESHKAKPEITTRTLGALTYAHEKDVLHEFCDVFAERNWYSLGFTGYKNFIDSLVADKKKSTGVKLSVISSKPVTNGTLCAMVAADPLASHDAEFVPVENLVEFDF
jgi:hypothetical protein